MQLCLAMAWCTAHTQQSKKCSCRQLPLPAPPHLGSRDEAIAVLVEHLLGERSPGRRTKAQGAVATRQQDLSTDSMYTTAPYAFVRLTLNASRSSSSESPSCIK